MAEDYEIDDPRALADRARAVVRRLRHQVDASPPGNPAELYLLLGTLRVLVDDLAHAIPVLQEALEEDLLDGRVVPARGNAMIEDVWTTVGAASKTLALAQQAGSAFSRELAWAQLEVRDLAAP